MRVDLDLYPPRTVAERLDGEAMLCLRFLPTMTGPHGAFWIDFSVDDGDYDDE